MTDYSSLREAFAPKVVLMSETGLALTLKEFCREVRISRQTFYALEKRGEAPDVIRVGTKILISLDTAKDWLKSRELACRQRNTKPSIAA